MMRYILIALAAIFTASVISGFAWWIAGEPGVILGLVIYGVCAIRAMAYLQWFNLPPLARSAGNWAIIVCLISMVVIWAANGVAKKVFMSSPVESMKTVKTVIALTDDGKPMPTVYVGPGTKHRIYANHPWKAVSRDKKGKLKEWGMPVGWSTWNGDDPSDYLWAKAVKKGTVLEFQN